MARSVGHLDDLLALEISMMKKLANPPHRLKGIREVAFFCNDPATLAGLQTARTSSKDEEAWYFFSGPSTNGYLAGRGRWNLINVMDLGNAFCIVGRKSTYNYYEGLTEGTKTEWYMSEFRDLNHQPHDQWLLIKLYRNRQENAEDDRNMDDADTASSSDPCQKVYMQSEK